MVIKEFIRTLFLGLVALLSGWFNLAQITAVNLSSEDEPVLFAPPLTESYL